MSGAYCKFCDNRCFVFRVLPDGSWSGHMATCEAGMEHDRKSTGFDHTTAINPAGRRERPGDQPLPTPSDGPSIQSLVRADLDRREQVGIERYGTPLQAFNGRNSLRDAYEEALDLATYLRQVLDEQDTLLHLLAHLTLVAGSSWDHSRIDDCVTEAESRIKAMRAEVVRLGQELEQWTSSGAVVSGPLDAEAGPCGQCGSQAWRPHADDCPDLIEVVDLLIQDDTRG